MGWPGLMTGRSRLTRSWSMSGTRSRRQVPRIPTWRRAMDAERFSRNIALFGRKGQEKIEAQTVGIVGLGGLGSHVAQQITYLGVRDQIHVDDDVISASSLNRVVTSYEGDADHVCKVEASRRLATAVASDAAV